MKIKNVVYVGGSYRNSKEYQVHLNILLAEKYSLALWKMGYVPLTPHKNFCYFGGELSDQYILDSCIELLKRCDYIYLLPNWKTSEGTKREYQFAKENGIPVLNDEVQLSI